MRAGPGITTQEPAAPDGGHLASKPMPSLSCISLRLLWLLLAFTAGSSTTGGEEAVRVIHVAAVGSPAREIVAVGATAADGWYASLVDARNEVRRLRSSSATTTSGIRVLVHAGVYPPFVLTAADSGRDQDSVTVWAAAGDGPVFISAGIALAAQLFKPSASHAGAFEADLKAAGLTSYGNISALDTGCGNLIHSDRSTVYFNMQPLTLARYPNIAPDGTWRYGYIDHGGESEFGVEQADPIAARLPVWVKEEREPWLHGYWKYSWADGYVPLRSATALPNGTVKVGVTKSGGEGGAQVMSGARFYGVNLLSELDSPGEFFIDDPSGTLYMIPPSGAGGPLQWPKDAVYVSKNATGLLLLNVSHVELQGLTVHAAVHSGVEASGVDGVVLRNLTVAGHGAHGIEMDGRNSGVVDSTVHSVGGSGMRVTGGETYTMSYGNMFVTGSHIHHVGLWKRTYQPQIFWGGVNNSYVGNLLEDGPAMCIWGGGNAVSSEMGGILTTFDGNRLNRCVTETCDQGAFHTCGDAGQAFISWGNVMENGVFENVQPDPTAVNPPRSLPSICYPHAVGFYLDCEISGWSARNNTFRGVDQAFLLGGGHGITIEGNAATGSSTFIEYLNEGMNWMHPNCLVALDGLRDLLAGPANATLAQRWPELWKQGEGSNLPTNHTCNPYDNRLVNNIYANTTAFMSSATLAQVVSWGGTIANNSCTTPPPVGSANCTECLGACSTACKCPPPWVPAHACPPDTNASGPRRRPYRDCTFEIEIGLYTSCRQGNCSHTDRPYQNITVTAHADADDCFRMDGCGMRGAGAASCMSGWNVTARYLVSGNGSFLADGSCCTVANEVFRWRKMECAAATDDGEEELY
jgi:hypothetical protein